MDGPKAKAYALFPPREGKAASVTWEVRKMDPTSAVLPFCSCFALNQMDGQEKKTQKLPSGGVSQPQEGVRYQHMEL